MSPSDPKGSAAAIVAALPLTIEQVFLSDPVLTLAGTDWNLTIWCGWEARGLGITWEDDDLEGRVQEFSGRVVTNFIVAAGEGPVFHCEPGVDLALNENEVDEPVGRDDPWSMNLPGLIITGGTQSPFWS
jgi:hypothetical protein